MGDKTQTFHDKWTLWTHLPHDTDWSLKSYQKIMTFNTINEIVGLYKIIPDDMIKNCMLFMMRDGINPIWEDEQNKAGGCFSYKIPNKSIPKIWRSLSYQVVGESISQKEDVCLNINGITISPKKSFCIVKIWFKSCKYKDPKTIREGTGLSSVGCIFKKHLK